MPADSRYPAPFDASTFLLPAGWNTFSDLLGGADTGLLCLREDVIIHVNTRLAEELGFEDAELVGRQVESLFPPDDMTPGEGWRGAGSEATHVRLTSKPGKPVRFRFVSNRIDTLNDASYNIWVLKPEHAANAETADASLLGAITRRLPEPVVVCGADSGLVYCSEAFGEMAGERDGMLSDLVHPEDRPKLLAAIGQSLESANGETAPLAFRLRHVDGTWRHMAGQACVLDPESEPGSVLISVRDVTQDMQRQQHVASEVKRQLHYLNRLLRLAHNPHANLDSALKVIAKSAAKAIGAHRCAFWELPDDASPARCAACYDDLRQNFVDEEIADPSFHPLLQEIMRGEQALVVADVDQDPRAAVYCEYFHAAAVKALIAVPVHRASQPAGALLLSVERQARQWTKDEAEFAVNVGELICLIFRQVERGREEAQLRHLAHHDSLTGLPNRHFLFDQAAEFFPKVTAGATTLAAFFIDLDGFKRVNDSFGHALGDELLKAAAMRLKNVVRKEDILVRLGGDEFMLVARNLSDMRIADDIALQIVETMRGPFSLQGRELQISASVGIAIYPFDGTDIDTLMKKADIAMYHAKSAGRDQYHMFGSQLSERATKRSTLEVELRQAIAERELVHLYQPQIDLRTGKVRCVEALLRWRHPRLGMLQPSAFLPVAEESGLMQRISAWSLNEACEQLRTWNMHGMEEFALAINLSASQLMDRTLLQVLESALDRTGVPAHRLEWEVKESTVMQHHTMTTSMLDRLAELRIGLSIDDFGTGYSSMAYLRRYPVRKVKIDSSFVDGLPGEGDDRAITDAIISMAHPLGLDVVAEGVETPQQMDYLRERGCDIAQGYFFTQPLTAEQLETWVIRH